MQTQQEAEEEFEGIPGFVTESSLNEEQFDQHQEDTILYPYPKYHDEADAEAHMRAFLTMWQANHVSQRLSKVDADKSKIAEFRFSLESYKAGTYP